MLNIFQNKRKFILYIALLAIFFLIIANVLYFLFFRTTKIEVDREENFYIDLTPMVVELKIPPTQDGKEYLKMNLTLLVSSLQSEKKEKYAYVNSKIPLIQDTILVFFSSLSVFDLKNQRNFFYLKEELLSRINKTIQPYFIDEVLFREFVTGF